VIERCFGIIKNKWRILGHLPSYPIHNQAQIIVGCMAFHNFIRESALYDDDFENYED
jgi:precorrin-4 methylase